MIYLNSLANFLGYTVLCILIFSLILGIVFGLIGLLSLAPHGLDIVTKAIRKGLKLDE